MKRTLTLLVAVVLSAGCGQSGSSAATGSKASGTATANGTASSETPAPPVPVEPTAEPTEAVKASPPIPAFEAITLEGKGSGFYDLPIPAFEDITLEGKGKKTANFTIPPDAVAVAVITHEGKGSFSVHSIFTSGYRDRGGLVDTTGAYSGTVLFDAGEEHTTAFVIDADGAWAITIKPVTSMAIWNPAMPLQGTGANVYLVVPQPGQLKLLDITYKGEDHFVVRTIGKDGTSVIANHVGDLTDRVWLPADQPSLLAVYADTGTWTITPD